MRDLNTGYQLLEILNYRMNKRQRSLKSSSGIARYRSGRDGYRSCIARYRSGIARYKSGISR